MCHLILGAGWGNVLARPMRKTSMASLPMSIQAKHLAAGIPAGWRYWLLLAAFSLLQACAQPSAIPVVERRQPPSEKINTHWVGPGETLYAIAWRYNLDADRLAQANGLQSGARIYRGQVLRLDLAQALREQRQKQPVRSVAANSSRSAPATNTNTNAKRPTARAPSKTMPEPPPVLSGNWHWPAQGSLLEPFSFRSGSGHKGVDIGGRSGHAVRAAHDGVVVYAGSGLPAYGRLLIVKHGEEYLSAYAHNQRLLVREGDRVSIGQKIAEMGRSGTTHEHLHFEIRKRGVPVNPLALLPKRKGLG